MTLSWTPRSLINPTNFVHFNELHGLQLRGLAGRMAIISPAGIPLYVHRGRNSRALFPLKRFCRSTNVGISLLIRNFMEWEKALETETLRIARALMECTLFLGSVGRSVGRNDSLDVARGHDSSGERPRAGGEENKWQDVVTHD